MKKWLNVLLIAIIFGALLYVIVTQFTSKESAKVETQENAYTSSNRYAAANFKLPTLAGDEIELTDTRGKITILNFWASWCGPCRDEAPHLQAFYEENKEHIELLAINVTSMDSIEKAQAFVDEYALTFPVLLDETGETSTTYGAFTIPTTVFLNEAGEIVHEIAGPLSENYLTDIISVLQHS